MSRAASGLRAIGCAPRSSIAAGAVPPRHRRGTSRTGPPRPPSGTTRRGRRVDLEHTEIAGGHLVERFRLFFIIVLGETVLTMGTAFADEPFALDRLLALAIGFAGTVALWWCYFHRAEGLGVEAAETAEDAGAVGLWGTWTLS